MADEIKRVGIELTAEGAKEFAASMNEVKAATKEAYSELKLAQSQYDKNTSVTKKLEDRQKYLSKATEEYSKKAQILEGELKELEGAENKDEAAIAKKRAELNQCNAKINEYQRALDDVNLKLKTHSAQLQEWGGKLQDIGGKVTAVGKSLTMKVTMPLAAVGAAGVKSFADVDKTMQLTNKTMNNSAEDADLLNRAMKDAAANSTFGMKDAAEATLNFARAGLDAEQAAAALAPAMNLAAGEGGSLDTVSAGLVATINGFHGSFEEAGNYADVFAAACNNSALDIDSLSNAMSVAAPIFSAAGYSVNDAALFMGVMANNGIEADKAANSLKTGLAKLVSPAKAGATMMDKLGISVTNSDGSMKDSVQIQQELHDAFANLSESEQIAAASAIFGKNQMAPWLALINTAPEDVDALNSSLENCAGTTDEMSEAMMSGFGGSLEKLKSSIDVLVTSIGEALAPVIQNVADVIQGLVDKFNALSPAQQETIVKIGLIAAALGPVLVIVGSIIGTVGTLMKNIGKLSEGMSALSSITSALTPVLSGISLPMLAVAAVVIAVAIIIYKNWDKIKKWAEVLKKAVVKSWQQMKQNVTRLVTSLRTNLTNIWNSIKDKISSTVTAIKNTVSKVFTAIKTVISTIITGWKNIITAGWNAIKSAVSTAVKAVRKSILTIFIAIRDKTKEIWEGIKTSITGHIDGAKEAVSGAVDTISSVVSNTFDSLKETVSNVWDSIKSAITGPIESAKKTVGSAVKKIKDIFPIKLGKIFSGVKLPHFKISGGEIPWGIGGAGKKPSVGIEWYRKAMNGAYALDGATIFGAMGGKALGGGEAGREIIIGEKRALDMISRASGSDRLLARINYLISLLEYYLPKRTGPNSRELNRMLGALL